MKKLIFAAMFLLAVPLIAQSHNITKDGYYYTIFRDSVRFTNLSTLTPRSDSIHNVNTGLAYEYGILTIDSCKDATLDSLRLTGGTQLFNWRGVVSDTLWGDELIIRDSSNTIRARAVASYTQGKNYVIFPLPQIMSIELINYRAALPTRVVNYTLTLYKRK